MSSWLRLSIFMVLVLATVALGFIAYTVNLPPKPVAQAPAEVQQPTLGYFVATRPLPTGTLLSNEDFEVRAAQAGDVPSGAIPESRDAKNNLRGSLIRNFVDAGRPITSHDVLQPRDRGLVASLLAPDTRAISINVDMESGVSGLISPGDYVDVVWTQTSDKEDRARHSPSERALHSLSEILVYNVRIMATDQDIAAGESIASADRAPTPTPTPASSPPLKVARSVTLELSPEQVKKIALAKDLGKLSLAVRSAVEVNNTAHTGAVLGSDLSATIASQVATQNAQIACQTAIARQFATVVVYAKGKQHEYTVKKEGIADARLPAACRGYPIMAPASAVALAGSSGEEAKD